MIEDNETEAVTSDPDLIHQIAASEAELANGEIVTAEELNEAMQRRLGEPLEN